MLYAIQHPDEQVSQHLRASALGIVTRVWRAKRVLVRHGKIVDEICYGELLQSAAATGRAEACTAPGVFWHDRRRIRALLVHCALQATTVSSELKSIARPPSREADELLAESTHRIHCAGALLVITAHIESVEIPEDSDRLAVARGGHRLLRKEGRRRRGPRRRLARREIVCLPERAPGPVAHEAVAQGRPCGGGRPVSIHSHLL